MTSSQTEAGSALKLEQIDFLRFRQLVQDRWGLHFPEKRRADLERGIRQAFAASTCTDLSEYYGLLQDTSDSAVHLERLVNALTIGETHFFRDAGQFDALLSHILPQIIERRRPLRTLRIWSAGCASGEEPYSIAILLRTLLPDVDEWSITILGTDINTEALDRARKASFGDWAFREERAKQWRPLFFRRKGKRYELVPEVRRMVTFNRLNLVGADYPAYESNTTYMDLILCRNVMMYFPELVTHKIVGRFHSALTDGGWLVVGHAEHSLITYRQFQVHNFPDAILYRRADTPSFLPRDWHWLAPPPRESDLVRAPPTTEAGPTLQPAHQGLPDVPAPPADTSQPEEEQLAEIVDPLEKAEQLLKYGRSEQARDVLLAAIDQQETPDGNSCSLLGQAYANLGKWCEAEQWCRQAIALDKLSLEAYYTMSLVLQHQGEIETAIDAMKKVVYINRHSVLGHFGLAGLYRNNDQLPQALKSLDNAYRLLADQAEDELVPHSGGITIGSLRETIIRQQQRWSATGDTESPVERQ